MTEHNVNGTSIRTAWLSDPIDGMPVLILPDDMDVDSTIQHEIFGELLEKLPIFCIDSMYRNGARLEFEEPVPVDQQVEEACEILRNEGIDRPVWFGDCARTSFACQAASRYPNSHVILSAPLFTENCMQSKLTLIRKLMHTVVKNGDITSYTLVNILLTMGTQFLNDNPYSFMTTNRRHKLLSIEQRELLLSHCFPAEDDPENMLEDIDGKILVISGTDDPIQHLRLLKQRLHGVSDCTHKVYECGHTVGAERREEYLNDILEFCRNANE